MIYFLFIYKNYYFIMFIKYKTKSLNILLLFLKPFLLII